MTDEEFERLTDEELDSLPEEVIRARTQALLIRGLLGEEFLGMFPRRVTDEELLSPPFYDEGKRRFQLLGWVAKAGFESETFQTRFHRLGAQNDRWKELQGVTSVGGSALLFIRLLTAREWFDGLCRERQLLGDEDARQSAVTLRTKIRQAHAKADRARLLDELTRFLAGGEARSPNPNWALLPVQKRHTAFRTFVIRLIAAEIRKFTAKPKHALIADLTQATVPESPDPVTVQHVRSALDNWTPPKEV